MKAKVRDIPVDTETVCSEGRRDVFIEEMRYDVGKIIDVYQDEHYVCGEWFRGECSNGIYYHWHISWLEVDIFWLMWDGILNGKPDRWLSNLKKKKE